MTSSQDGSANKRQKLEAPEASSQELSVASAPPPPPPVDTALLSLSTESKSSCLKKVTGQSYLTRLLL
jgi:hypothetical protein